MRIDKLWKRLNHLVPEPDCDTFEEDFSKIVWRDTRAKPTQAALLALTDQEIEDKIVSDKTAKKDRIKTKLKITDADLDELREVLSQ